MRRLILDHFRRWSGVLMLCAALAFSMGWFMAIPVAYLGRLPRGLGLVALCLKTYSSMYEFTTLTLATLSGAYLLPLDLRRGIVRTLVLLPITTREVGRSWWLAMVAIPAIGVIALLSLGVGTFCWLHPKEAFPSERLALASLFTLLWPGITFASILGARAALSGRGCQRTWSTVTSLLGTVTMFVGISFFQNELSHPFRFALFVAAGVSLSVRSWFQAGRFDPSAGVEFLAIPRLQHLSANAGDRVRPLEPRLRLPAGYGGMAYLIRRTLVEPFAFGVALYMLLMLMTPRMGPAWSRSHSLTLITGMTFLAAAWKVGSQLVLAQLHLRFLRTLPISTTRLAALLLALTFLPLLALAAVIIASTALAWGIPLASEVLTNCTIDILPALLCALIVIWRGPGMLGNALVLVALVVFQIVCLQIAFLHPRVPFGLINSLAGLSVAVVFLLARLVLRRSSRPYRVQPNPFGNLPYGRITALRF